MAWLPVYCELVFLPQYSLRHTEGSTSFSQENSSIESVMPSASGVSLAVKGCGLYLNSFFNTESEKKGFSLKNYADEMQYHEWLDFGFGR
jgi:hypothetical protein